MTLAAPTATSVTVTWTNPSAVATDYRVERSTDGVNFSYVGHTGNASVTTFADTGLTEGTQYYYRVYTISLNNASNKSSVQSITTLPAAPTGLNATLFSTTEIDLGWTDVAAAATAYAVQQSTNGGANWTTLTSALAANATTYNVTGLAEATDYEYRVYAIGAGGGSADSNVLTGTTLPATPTNLAATANSATSVGLTWTDNSAGESAYEVQRSTGGAWTTLTTSLAPNTTTYTDTTAVEGTGYQYRVRANRNGAESAYSTSFSITTPPAAPTLLTVVSTTSSRVNLGWTDNSNGETGFRINRSTDGGITWSLAGSVAANATTFADNSVSEGISYMYEVYAYNTGGSSTLSNTPSANIPPAAPTGLTSSNVSGANVTLTWVNHSSHQTGFYVERSTNGGGTWTQIADVTSGVTYNDTGVAEATAYQYRVRAYGTTGTSTYGGSISVATPVNMPTGLTPTVVSTTEIDLAWVDNSNQENGYSLQRSTDGGNTWNTTISLPANSTSYQDTSLTEGTTYTYRLQATRTGKNSAFTPNQTATTLPAAPSGITATAAGDTQVTVTWTNNSIGATGFTIERSLNGTVWTSAGTTNGSTFTFTDTGLTELTAYSYRVKATDAGGPSAWNTTGSNVTTLPSAPSSLVLTTPASDRVTLTWTDNSAGATGYKVERSSGGAFTLLTTLPASATTFTDLTVNEATLYTYRVRAVSNAIYSAYCPSQSLTTVPLAPDTLATTTVSTTEIDLTWHNNSTGATHYLVERSTDGGANFTQLASLGANATSYTDTGLTEGTDYQYRVRAQDAGGYSDYTISVAGSTLPAGPSNLQANAAAGEIDLTWNDNSTGESSYIVQRFNGGAWTTIATLAADTTSFSDTGATGGLTSGQTYQYRVYCAGNGGNSAVSPTASAVAV